MMFGTRREPSELTTVRYCSICPSTRPSLNWSLYCGRPMSSSQPLEWRGEDKIRVAAADVGTSGWRLEGRRPTSDPDEIQLGRLLALLVADTLDGQLELLPVQRILHPQFLWTQEVRGSHKRFSNSASAVKKQREATPSESHSHKLQLSEELVCQLHRTQPSLLTNTLCVCVCAHPLEVVRRG